MRLITLNLWGRQGPWEARWALAARQLNELAPDVLCLQEVPDMERLSALADATNLLIHIERTSTSGLAILARSVDRDVGWQPCATRSRFFQAPREFCWTVLESGLRVMNTHLSYHKLDEESRLGEVSELVAWMEAHPGPVALCGDFNAEIGFPSVRRLLLWGLRDTASEDVGPTWSNDNPYTEPWRIDYPEMRIDLILVSDGFTVSNARIVLNSPDDQGHFPSDHFGYMVDLSP